MENNAENIEKMKVIQPDDDVLMLRLPETPLAWAGPLLLCGCFVLSIVRFFIYQDPLHNELFQGSVAGTLFFLIWCAFAMEFTQVVFDRKAGKVTWQRRYGFILRKGTVSFDEISGVIEQSILSDGTTASQRLALITKDRTIPLSLLYSKTLISEEKYAKLASRIQAFIKVPASDGLSQSVCHAIKNSNRIQAVQLLRDQKKISLAEAQAQVKKIEEKLT